MCAYNLPSTPGTTAYELVFFIQWRPILLHAVVAYVRNRQFYLMMPYNMYAFNSLTLFLPVLSDLHLESIFLAAVALESRVCDPHV